MGGFGICFAATSSAFLLLAVFWDDGVNGKAAVKAPPRLYPVALIINDFINPPIAATSMAFHRSSFDKDKLDGPRRFPAPTISQTGDPGDRESKELTGAVVHWSSAYLLLFAIPVSDTASTPIFIFVN